MAYSKTSWLDRIVATPNLYDKSGESGIQVTLVQNPGTITQAGTPINAANLNKLEQGVFDAHNAIAIPPSSNLNSYTTEGNFYCGLNSDALTLANRPTDVAFNMRVYKHAGVNQLITEYINSGAFRIFTRNYYTGTWGSWYQIYNSGQASASGGANTLVLRDGSGKVKASGLTIDNGHLIEVVPAGGGEARYHLYNQGGVAEWLFGQKSGTDHDFKVTKSVAGVESDYLVVQPNGNVAVPAGDLVLRGTSMAATRLNAGKLEFWDGGSWKVAGGMKSVQRGLTLAGTTTNVTISAVDMSKSFVTCNTNVNGATTTARLTSSTNIELYVGTGSANLAWEVIEFY